MPRIFAPDSEKPYELHSLKQAAFVLRAIEKGASRRKLVEIFRDEWTVDFWFYFLRANDWMERDSSGQWIVTEHGKTWAEKCDASTATEGQGPKQD